MSIFDRVFSKKTVRKTTYTKTTTYGSDGKSVKEIRILNDGGEAETSEEVKAAEAEMEKEMAKMDRFFAKMDEVFKGL